MQRLSRFMIVLLALHGCAQVEKLTETPHGQATLEAAPPGHNFESFLDRATRESEIFRRRFIAGHGPAVMEATLKFRGAAIPLLKGRPGIDGFQLEADRLLDQVRGTERLSGERVFGAFTGRWYGLWTDFEVDHHWGNVLEYDEPRRVDIPGSEKPVWIRGYQYAWVGDGYGLNLIASSDPASSRGDYILGYVIHVEDGILSKERMSRPHVGVFTGRGQLIWITAKEVFLEASYTNASGKSAYSITGFRYEVPQGNVRIMECFQAVYTTNPDQRTPFFSFSLP